MDTMKDIIKNVKITTVLLSLVSVLIITSLLSSFYNHRILEANDRLRMETEQIKRSVSSILTNIIHGADLSIRGYALTKDDRLLEPFRIVVRDKKILFEDLQQRLEKQGYKTEEFKEVKQLVEEYLTLSQFMIDLVRKDSLESFTKIMKEDRGYALWKKYEAFYLPLFSYEDQLNAKAAANFESAILRNRIIQLLLFLIGIPSIGFINYKLKREEKQRRTLMSTMLDNNRKYVFDPGTTRNIDNQEDFATEFIDNFQKANDFITRISKGDYTVQWKGLDKSLEKLNNHTLAGKMVSMRDQLIAIEVEAEKRKWTNEGLTRFSELIRNHQKSVEDLSHECIRFLCNYLHAQQGSLFVLNEDAHEPFLELTSCFAFERKKFIEKRIEIGNGLVGQVYLEGEIMMMTQVPQGYLHITSGLGHATPACVVIVPMKYHEKTEGVIELASFKKLEEHELAFLERCGEFVAATLRSAKNYDITKKLLEESQQQSKELKLQEEEMRQNLEEMKATEETSRKREIEMQSYISALNVVNASTANIEFTPDGEIVNANKNFLDLIGYTLKEIQGKHHRIFVPEPFASSEEYTMFWRDLKLGKTINSHFQRRNKQGHKIWLSGTYAPMKDHEGRVIKIVKLAQDITDEKRKMLELKSRTSAFDDTMLSIDFSLEGQIVDANKKFLQTTGYSLEEIRGENHRIFVDLKKTRPEEYAKFWEELGRGQPQRGELLFATKNGCMVWLDASYTPVKNEEGVVYKIITFAKDITKQKNESLELENQLNAVNESYNIVEFALDGSIVKANNTFLTTMGYRLSEVVGKHHRILIDDHESMSDAYKSFWKRLAQGQFVEGEFEQITKEGKKIILKATYTAVRDLKGVPYKIMKIAHVIGGA